MASETRREKCGNPQTEDGFTKIANELMEAVARANLTKEQHSVLYFIFSKTYGWKKKEDWISTSQISSGTGISPEHCSRAVCGLVRKGVLVRRIEKRRATLGIQKQYTKWTCLRPELPAEKTRWRKRDTVQPQLAGSTESQPELAGKFQPESAGYKSTVTKAVDEVRRDPETNATTEVLTKLDANLGGAGMNQDVVTLAMSMVEAHGKENVLRSISETAIRLIPPSQFMSYMRSMLESQAKVGYTWEAKRPTQVKAAPPPPPKSDRQTWFEAQPMYRELTTVYSRPVQEMRMRRLLKTNAPDLDIDITPLSPDAFVLAVYGHRKLDVPAFSTATAS